jgi:uncharacterized membrane protein
MKNRYIVSLIQNLDLLIVLIITAPAVPLMMFDPGIFRAIFAILFLFFAPGYSLVSALFPGVLPLGNLERLICSLVASIAVVGLTGVALNYTSLGVSLLPAVIIISIFNFILLIVALIRRLKLPSYERFSFGSAKFSTSSKNLIIISLAVFLVAVLAVGSILVVDHSAPKETDEFSLLPLEGNTYNYPRAIKIGESVAVRAIIVNHSAQPKAYCLNVITAGQVLSSFTKIDLKSGEKWDQIVKTQPINTGENQKIEYVLSVNGGKDMKDTLYIYIDVSGK